MGGALQRVSRPGDGRAPPEFTGASGDTPRWLLPALGVVAGLTVLSSLFRESGSDALFELYPTATGQLVDQYERLYVQDGRGFLYRLMQVPPEFVGAEESGSAPTVLVLVGNLEDPSDPPLNAGMLFTLSEVRRRHEWRAVRRARSAALHVPHCFCLRKERPSPAHPAPGGGFGWAAVGRMHHHCC